MLTHLCLPAFDAGHFFRADLQGNGKSAQEGGVARLEVLDCDVLDVFHIVCLLRAGDQRLS